MGAPGRDRWRRLPLPSPNHGNTEDTENNLRLNGTPTKSLQYLRGRFRVLSCFRGESDAGDDRSDSGHGESAPETTNQAPEQTDRAPSGRVERRSRHSGSSSRRTDPAAGVFDSDESSRACEQARGPPKLAYDSRSERFERRRRQPLAGAGGRTAEQTVPDVERPNGRRRERLAGRANGIPRRAGDSPAAGAIPERERTSACRSIQFPAPVADSLAGANRSAAEQTDPRRSKQIRGTSSQIHACAATRRVRVLESVSVHRRRFSNEHSVLPSCESRPATKSRQRLCLSSCRPRAYISGGR